MRKMSALLSEKNLSENSNSFSLPPSVNGKLHGFCTLSVGEINWTTTKTFNLVKLKINWWGERQGNNFDGIRGLSSSKRLKSSTELAQNKPLLSVRYRINTNYRLFQSYLKNCEPLLIEIFSSKTSDLIGIAKIPLATKLHNNLEEESLNYTFSSDIVSARNFKLGKITLTLDIKMHVSGVHSIKTASEKEDIIKSATTIRSKANTKTTRAPSETNKENIKIIGKKKAISFRDQKPLKPTTLRPIPSSRRSSINYSNRSTSSSQSTITTSRITSSVSDKEASVTNREPLKINSSENMRNSSLINYLSGHPMTRNEEDKILNEIIQMSPSHSVIEEINKIDYTQQPPPTSRHMSDAYTIQINLCSLELNEIGLLEVRNYCRKFQNSKFIFKCALTSKLFKAKDLNFISSVFDNFPSKKTTFNKQLKQRVRVDWENAAKVYLNFGFCLKSIEEIEIAPHLIGFTRVNVADIVASKMRYNRKCAVIDEQNTVMGAMMVNIQIGKRFSYEMENYEDFNVINNERISNPSNNLIEKPHSSRQLIQQQVTTKITSHPSNSNDDCERHYENKNMQTDSSESNTKFSGKESGGISEQRDTEMIDVEFKENKRKSKVYQGLLFVESLRNIRDQQQHESEYFITYEGFWNECQESSELSVNSVFNYLKQFPVMCDDDFLKRVQNNHLELKLWEKTNEISEKFIGATKVPLHQFYIAFKDTEMIEHLSTNKLPIISTDTWCNFISPLSSELYCQAKILLAIGSENQIDYLKLSRNLHNLPSLQRTNLPREFERTNTTDTNLNVDPNAQIKSKLTAFIESLSQKLPEPSGIQSLQTKLPSTSSSSSSILTANTQPQLRRTSDLLDTLQKALAQPPSPNANPFSTLQNHAPTTPSEVSFNQTQLLNDCIKMQVCIEQAANLPKVVVKKCRNKRKSKGTPPQRLEYEPHTYATFEATTDHLNEKSLPTNAIKSHEGIVYCTSVVKSCEPEWNQDFEVYTKFDVLRNPQKKFVVKIWRKASHNPAKIEASPFEDSVIGFTAIDLSALLTGLPMLSGYYNIVDFSGRCNGQLKISIRPLDEVSKFRNPESPLVPLTCPLNIDVHSSESSNDGSSSLLSRTLKRKFTELDEITQRLKARLFDVTGDENFDPDEEFERDLNTAVDDDGDIDFDNKEDFGWLKKDDDDDNFKCLETEQNKVVDSQEQTSSKNSVLTRRDTGTGCSSSDEALPQPPFAMDDLLKKFDLDTLINPNIFKNLIDPNLANSDSTPTLVPKPVNDDENEQANESDVTTVSSISNDQVQTIQKALQRTSLHDQSKSRKAPDGHNNISE